MNKHEKLAINAKSYLPEWKFDPTNPDAGSTVAILIDEMINQTSDNFDKIMHKHKIQYLNLFDKLKEEPIESAKSYVKFNPVSGVDEPVFIPKSTELLASDDSGEVPMSFETDYAITVTNAKVETIFSTCKSKDFVSELYNAKKSENFPKNGIKAFDISGENSAVHSLIIGFDRLFDNLSDINLGIKFSTIDENELSKTVEFLSSEQVSYSFLEKEGSYNLPKPTVKNNIIYLDISGYQPQKSVIDGQEFYFIELTSLVVSKIEISDISVEFSSKNIPCDIIYQNGIEQDKNEFSPFGNPLEIYSECGIECENVLSRRGAKIDLNFKLSFNVVEQDLPEYEYDNDLKVVMRKPKSTPKAQRVDIKADYVLIEYLSESGWKRLINEQHIALIFNGSVNDDVQISFVCPQDIVEVTGEERYRLRMRLMRADNLYSLPNRMSCPVISNLNFSYTYKNAPVNPKKIMTENNFDKCDLTDAIGKKRSLPLFYNKETQNLCMYFGFDSNPTGSPLSLYFNLQNNQDIKIDYTVQYLTDEGFLPLQTIDNTGGWLYSGNMLLLLPKSIKKKVLFGNDLYWIRFICSEKTVNLPLIKEIETNMVRVHNRRTRIQEFFIDKETSSVTLQLEHKNLISVKVYINELNDSDEQEDNWVLWEKRSHFSEQGRFYNVDFVKGTIEFDKNIFASYPLSIEGASAKIEYREYQGSRANVAIGAINETADSLKFISSVSNPVPAYGGYDGYNEKTSAFIISNMLRTRGRAVSNKDYFDIISQVSYGVKQIKCVSGVNRLGEKDDDLVTVALLIDEYEKGSHIFSAVKDTIYNKLLATSNIVPLGKSLQLSQPHFVEFSVRIWIESTELDNIYDLQNQTNQNIIEFIDPLNGGFERKGWEIGRLPTTKQLVAYLKMKTPNISIVRMSMVAITEDAEITVDEDINTKIKNPFAMAVNGEHTVYVNISN